MYCVPAMSTEVSVPTKPKPLAARPNRANLLMVSTVSHIPSASKGTLYLVLTVKKYVRALPSAYDNNNQTCVMIVVRITMKLQLSYKNEKQLQN